MMDRSGVWDSGAVKKKKNFKTLVRQNFIKPTRKTQVLPLYVSQNILIKKKKHMKI